MARARCIAKAAAALIHAAWAARLVARRGPNVAAVALANHNARVLWALLSRGDGYRPPTSNFPSRPSAGAVIKRAREGKPLLATKRARNRKNSERSPMVAKVNTI